MRLKNSITPLLNTLERKAFTKESFTGLVEFSTTNYPRVKDHDLSARMLMWNRVISNDDKERIIVHSIPSDEWVGGYADYTDAQLDTLLKKVINKLN